MKKTIINKSVDGRYICYGEILGKGAYKIVHRGYDTHNGIEVAWNSINYSHLSEHGLETIMNEINILEEISPSNTFIVDLFDAWIDEKSTNIILITEIALSGTLLDYMHNSKINMKIIKKWCTQLLRVINFLHINKIVYRDLKLNNILYNANTGNILLCDFGLANKCEHVLNDVVGTPRYMAPEIYYGNYDEKVDIWSFGMCMLELITGEMPYINNPLGTIYKNVTSGVLPSIINKIKNIKSKNIIFSCLHKDPMLRPSAEELLNNSFFVDTSSDISESMCLKITDGIQYSIYRNL